MGKVCLATKEPSASSIWLVREENFAGNKETQRMVSDIKGLLQLKDAMIKKIKDPDGNESIENDFLNFDYRSFEDYVTGRLLGEEALRRMRDDDGYIDLTKVPQQALAAIRQIVQTDLYSTIRLVEDPIRFIRNNINSEIMASTIKAMTTMAKASDPYFFGIKWAKFFGGLIGNKQPFFRRFRPAQEMLGKIEKIENFLNDAERNLSKRAEAFSKLLKQTEIGASMNDYFPMLNEYRPYSVDSNNQKIRNIKEKMESDERIDNAKVDIDAVIETMVTKFKPKWDRINYGDSYVSLMSEVTGDKGLRAKFTDGDSNRLDGKFGQKRLKKLQKSVSDDSFLGLKRLGLEYYREEIYNLRKQGENTIPLKKIEKQLGDMEEGNVLFGGTLGYVPGLKDDGVFKEKESGEHGLFPEVIGSLEKAVTGERGKGFIEGFGANMLEFTRKMKLVSDWSGWSYIEAKRQKYRSWADNSPGVDRVLRVYYEKLTERANFSKQMTTNAKIGKNIFPALNGLSAATTLFVSGVNNLVYGIVGTHLKFSGYNKMKQDYYRQIEDEGTIAHILEEGNYQAFGQNMGLGQPYLKTAEELRSSGDEKLVNASRKVNEWMNNVGNKLIEKGPLGMVGINYKNGLGYLGFMGTEQKVRSIMMPIMHTEISNEIERMKLNGEMISNPSVETLRKNVDKIWNRRFGDVHQRVLEAVGAFDKRYKAFWSYHKLETADTLPQVLLGTLGQSLHLFRQVPIHLANLTKTSFHGTKDLIRSKIQKDGMRTNMSVGGGGILAAMILAAYDMIFADLIGVNFNVASNANPFTPATGPLKAPAKRLYTHFLAPMLDLPVSEEQYKDASGFFQEIGKDMLTGAGRFSGGFLFGKAIEDMIDGQIPGKRLAEAAISGEIIGRNFTSMANSFYTFVDNPFSLLNMSNDVLKLLRIPIKMWELVKGDARPAELLATVARNIFGVSSYDPSFFDKEIRTKKSVGRFLDLYSNSSINLDKLSNQLIQNLGAGYIKYLSD